MNKINENKWIIILILIVGSFFVLPWKNINWGKFELASTQTVVVTGEAKTTQKNQIASFTAGVNTINIKKEDAVAETNKKIGELIDSVKKFGIPSEDIKTQNMSVYQQQDPSLPAKTGSNNGQWTVNNSIEIVLRDVDKANQLADLLNSSGANNVYGPNFRMDDTSSTEKALYDEAIKDARSKAELIAKASGRSLGKVVNVNDGASSTNYYPVMMKAADAGGGAVTEPGSATINKSLTVSFELN